MSIFPLNPKLKILFVTSEEAPFAKVGGLGEVMFSLPRALCRLGHDARVMIPYYGTIDRAAHNYEYMYKDLGVPTAPQNGGKRLSCNVRRYDPSGDSRSPVTTYFLENEEYYELRANIYGYGDDRTRFALLSRACLEFLNLSREWMPDVVVSTDWMTGYLSNFLKIDYKEYARLSKIATVFSIHNLASQGMARNHKFLQESERDDGNGPLPDFFSERMRFINSMKRGILHADLINTVSPTYANEITTEEFGEGLDALLREKRGKLFGVLNGLDFETMNPATDPHIAKNFTSGASKARMENKFELQRRFGLPPKEDAFMVCIVSRLVRQKGFELLMPVLADFLKTTQVQILVIGTGDTEIMNFFQELEKSFPDQARTILQYDDTLPRLAYAGCDAVLIPSKFEPCGLTQMEAMHFGAIPIARKVGGLADTIEDYSPEKEEGTGFLFEEFDSNALLMAMTRAFTNWRHKPSWSQLQKRVMEKDFSWDRSAKEYVELFKRAIRIHEEEMKKPKQDLG